MLAGTERLIAASAPVASRGRDCLGNSWIQLVGDDCEVLRWSAGGVAQDWETERNARCAPRDSHELVDTENVLLYKVGASHNPHLAATGLTFERSHGVPACPDPMTLADLHYHAFELVADQEQFQYWRPVDELAAFQVHGGAPKSPGTVCAATR